MIHSGLSTLITNGKEPWTLHNHNKDCERTRLALEFKEIAYPKPDGVLSFDLLTNLQRSGEFLLCVVIYRLFLLYTLIYFLTERGYRYFRLYEYIPLSTFFS